MQPTERLARAISIARHGCDAYWPNYLLAAVAAKREMHAIIAGAESPEVLSLSGYIDRH
ncbi:hypothetical protein [Mesorhizobium sp. Root157]|uniref:hypothetical protein n=1 Tax=Mesorhizobium sp. Root157 TaxID=1736477 RepID=UPI000A5522F7|nr:hypothetical protein [Mesorhizobium sp. Root157]